MVLSLSPIRKQGSAWFFPGRMVVGRSIPLRRCSSDHFLASCAEHVFTAAARLGHLTALADSQSVSTASDAKQGCGAKNLDSVGGHSTRVWRCTFRPTFSTAATETPPSTLAEGPCYHVLILLPSTVIFEDGSAMRPALCEAHRVVLPPSTYVGEPLDTRASRASMIESVI